MARGAFPDDHPLCLGMPGMHGNYTAVTAMQAADLLIALGSRFDDRVTGKLDGFAPDAKVIHVDVDPAELGKVRNANVPIVGDCRQVIERAGRGLRSWAAPRRPCRHRRLALHGVGLAGEVPAGLRAVRTRRAAQAAVRAGDSCAICRRRTPSSPRASASIRCGASQFWTFRHPYTWINSGGLGTMGFSVPAAIGAKVGMPGRTVWSVDGDGCFQMTAQELVTAATERIPVKVAILNNAYLGMVRQWQEMFYEERYTEVLPQL